MQPTSGPFAWAALYAAQVLLRGLVFALLLLFAYLSIGGA